MHSLFFEQNKVQEGSKILSYWADPHMYSQSVAAMAINSETAQKTSQHAFREGIREGGERMKDLANKHYEPVIKAIEQYKDQQRSLVDKINAQNAQVLKQTEYVKLIEEGLESTQLGTYNLEQAKKTFAALEGGIMLLMHTSYRKSPIMCCGIGKTLCSHTPG